MNNEISVNKLSDFKCNYITKGNQRINSYKGID